MIMKIPTSPVGSGYYEHEPAYEVEYDVSSIESDEVAEDDFSEYLWMEFEDEFDKLEIERLEEEALMEQCIEAMLQDEIEELEKAETAMLSETEMCRVLSTLSVSEKDIEKSTLNPLAAEFVPYLVQT